MPPYFLAPEAGVGLVVKVAEAAGVVDAGLVAEETGGVDAGAAGEVVGGGVVTAGVLDVDGVALELQPINMREQMTSTIVGTNIFLIIPSWNFCCR